VSIILHSDLFPIGYPLVQRLYFSEPVTAAAVIAPDGSAWVRTSASGAGGFKDNADGWGGGAAFAFAEEACLPGNTFSVQLGDTQHSRPATDDNLGDSWVKRGDSSIMVYADRGRHGGSPGLASRSTGSITRDGTAGTSGQGGASAGDDIDPWSLGFGGQGANPTRPAWYGAGGGHVTGFYLYPTFPAGDGLVCLEFYQYNPLGVPGSGGLPAGDQLDFTNPDNAVYNTL
jgi:hypothetical protein